MDNSTYKPTYDEWLALVETMRAENAALKARVDQLERELAAAMKTSRNSSKPPSSDITKPPKTKTKGRGKRKKGAQLRHPKHSRPGFTSEQIDDTVEHAPDTCPDCGGKLEDDGQATVLQQAELVAKPLFVTEHRATPKRCSCCGKAVRTAIPNQIRAGGLCGPRLTAVAAFLKGGCRGNASNCAQNFEEVAVAPARKFAFGGDTIAISPPQIEQG